MSSNSEQIIHPVRHDFEQLIAYVTDEASQSQTAYEAEYCTTGESYGESLRVIEPIVGLSISKQARESGVQADATDVDAFYEQKPSPPPDTEGSILVIQADGTR